MLLTDRPDEFARQLRVADVLVFDSLSLPGGLVQWVDRAPANHVALVLNDELLVEANRDGIDDHRPAIRTVPLVERLALESLVSVRALRHPQIDADAGRGAAVAGRARELLELGAQFSYLELGLVGGRAALRSYGDDLASPLGRAMLPLLRMVASLAADRVSSGTWTVSCSEFVYRCLTECRTEAASVRVEITSPLVADPADLTSDAQVRAAVQVDDELWDGVERANRGATGGDKYEVLAGEVVADRVTPGDLLRSPSFAPVAVLLGPAHAFSTA